MNKRPDANDIWQWAMWGALIGISFALHSIANSLKHIAAAMY